MARTKIDNTPAAKKVVTAPSTSTSTLAETGIIGVIPLVDPTPVMPPPKGVNTAPAPPPAKWRALNAGVVAIRGACVTVKAGQVLSSHDDLDTFRLGGIQLEEI